MTVLLPGSDRPQRLRPGSLLAALNGALGSALLLAGPARTGSASFVVPLQIMPARAWGVAFLLAAFACLLAPSVRTWGAALVAAASGLYAVWAVAFGLSAVHDPNAGVTGVVVYGWLAVVHAFAGHRLARLAG